MRLRKKTKPVDNSVSTGLFDDNDREINIGDTLQHEYGFKVEVVKLSHGEITGKVIDFCNAKTATINYSLNNGKGYTIINR